MKKRAVKVYLSREQTEMLEEASRSVGEDLSSYARMVLVNHLKELNLIKERVHHGENIPDRT